MALTSALRREKWGWLPVLFLKAKGRSAVSSTVEPAPTLDANAQNLLRMVAQMLPQCVPEEASERRELEEISDQLEVLAGGMPEQEWAESLANDLAMTRRIDPTAPQIRVSWGRMKDPPGSGSPPIG
jgi:hypothetical protein